MLISLLCLINVHKTRLNDQHFKHVGWIIFLTMLDYITRLFLTILDTFIFCVRAGIAGYILITLGKNVNFDNNILKHVEHTVVPVGFSF